MTKQPASTGTIHQGFAVLALPKTGMGVVDKMSTVTKEFLHVFEVPSPHFTVLRRSHWRLHTLGEHSYGHLA